MSLRRRTEKSAANRFLHDKMRTMFHTFLSFAEFTRKSARPLLFVSAWAFVFVAAAYDALFAWCHRASLACWELNPLARWAVGHFGLGAVIALKFAGLVFAVRLAAHCQHSRQWLVRCLTVTGACVYGLLALYYVANDPPLNYAAQFSAQVQVALESSGLGNR
jgi:hypothetical protein